MKNKKSKNSVIYSTNPNFKFEDEEKKNKKHAPKNQKLKLYKQRYKGGKVAIIIEDFIGSKHDLKNLANVLKSKCGVGGSAKDGKIIIQGDIREKIMNILEKEGYGYKRIGG